MQLLTLWYENHYVEVDGSSQKPELLGTFTDFDALKQYIKDNWVDMPIDTQEGIDFSPDCLDCSWAIPHQLWHEGNSSGTLSVKTVELISARQQILPGATVRHFKGGLYRVLAPYTPNKSHKELETLVIADPGGFKVQTKCACDIAAGTNCFLYESVRDHEKGIFAAQFWLRPCSEFHETVVRQRFTVCD